MSRRRFQQAATALMAVGALVLVAAGCSSSDTSSPVPSDPTSGPTSLPVSSPVPSPVTVSTGMFSHTQSAACDTDLTLMETAVESYLAINGGTEVTETELVEQGVVREPSSLHDIGPNATVIPSPTGGCAS